MQSNEEQASKIKRQKRKFTADEDQKIQEFVRQHGAKQWDLLASLMVDRTPRQCRDRWKHYLSPDVIHTSWSIEEDKNLIQLTTLFGKKWATLVKFFPGRTDINLKNHWNKLQRNLKKINVKNEDKVLEASGLETCVPPSVTEIPPAIQPKLLPEVQHEILPGVVQTEIPSTIVQTEVPPVSVQISNPPVAIKTEIPPVAVQITNPPVSVKTEIPPAVVHTEIPPAVVQIANPPVAVQITNPPPVVQTEIPPAVGIESTPAAAVENASEKA